ncbi:MAG TPA: VWA domain-containing protein [Candidatus Angelobacter sp.]|nr:VWA domain-containing protein [Candidatus Angelobacter sp.]
MSPGGAALEHAIVDFCRFAQAQGLPAGVKESMAALEAVGAVGVSERETFKAALRAVLCSSKGDWDLFDELFDTFWSSDERSAERLKQREKHGAPAKAREARQEQDAFAVPIPGKIETAEGQEGESVLGATVQERLRQADFSQIASADLADLEQIALRLLRQMSLRLSRRLRAARLRGKVDLRRTIRLSIGRGGDPIDLSFRNRRLQQLRLVILLDVSGSMNPYSVFLARFAYALQKYFKRVDTFLFSTRLTDITSALRTRHLSDALQAVAQQATDWSGGTRIGESLREFTARHGSLLSRNTLFMVLSDGWDTGEPETLAAELSAIKQRVRKLIWLNPLLGMEGYEPVTRGMSAALPHIDVFAPAHNLQSLLELEGHLR